MPTKDISHWTAVSEMPAFFTEGEDWPKGYWAIVEFVHAEGLPAYVFKAHPLLAYVMPYFTQENESAPRFMRYKLYCPVNGDVQTIRLFGAYSPSQIYSITVVDECTEELARYFEPAEPVVWGWHLIEVFGRKKFVALVDEVEMCGLMYLRLRIPPDNDMDLAPCERFLNPKAVYGITPITPEAARELAPQFPPHPRDLYSDEYPYTDEPEEGEYPPF